jgi:flagellum-specific peptidoglycan hydrolase FlgJ
MQSIDLTQVIARRPFFQQKRRRLGLWATLVVSNAFWCCLTAVLLLSVIGAAQSVRWATTKFYEQRTRLAEIEAAKAQAVAERDAKIANLLRFQSSSTSDILTMARTINVVYSTASNSMQEKFFEDALPEALRIQITEGIPASAVMAQAILESSYGQSSMARIGHNYFGMKAFDTWKGDRMKNLATLDDGTIPTVADFRAYPTLADGFDGYVAFLRAGNRYDRAFDKHTGAEFIETVLKAGYCGDPRYMTMIHQIIARHHLEKLDEIYAAQLAKGTTTVAKNGAS